MSRALVAELIGTFFLVLTIGFVVVGEYELGALAVGAVLIALVYMGAPASGAHYNPAVTIALAVRGTFPWSSVAPYIVAQFVSAMLATMGLRGIVGSGFELSPAENLLPVAPWAVEILFTFLLVLVILVVATSKKTRGNEYYGLAIGLTVMAAAFVGGPISGAALNPAVGVGPALAQRLMGEGSLASVPLYIFAPLVGALLANGAFKLMEPDEARS